MNTDKTNTPSPAKPGSAFAVISQRLNAIGVFPNTPADSLAELFKTAGVCFATSAANVVASLSASKTLTRDQKRKAGLEALKLAQVSDACMQHAAAVAVSKPEDGVHRIAEERARQLAVEGFTPEHDDIHRVGELTDAAACYLLAGDGMSQNGWSVDRARIEMFDFCWPWADEWCKPKSTPDANYAIAGALIAAEMDRVKRLVGKGGAR